MIFNNINTYVVSEQQIVAINNSKISVLVLDYDYKDQEKDLLIKILKAINLSPESVNLIKISNEDVHCSRLIRTSNITSIIVFGKNARQIGFNFESVLYQWMKLEDAKLLFCDTLAHINQNKPLKMALWNQLKQMDTL